MSLESRLAKLEQRLAAQGCPDCANWTISIVDADQAAESWPRCPRCGRVPDLLQIRELVVDPIPGAMEVDRGDE